MESAFVRSSMLMMLFFLPLSQTKYQQVITSSTCASSSPNSGAYSVTVCFTAPSAGSSLTGVTTVTATVSVSGGTSPGVQRVVFYLDGAYLLTDYQSTYTFKLPTDRWLDGNYTLSVEAWMRDGYITAPRTSLSVIFSNGVTSLPVNTNQFQPTSGRAPANGAPFIVAAGGDGASGDIYAGRVSNLINSLHPNLFLYLGDVYEKGSPTEFYNWYGTPSTYFGRLRSITNPTIGNHEYQNKSATGYFDYWDNIPNYYSYDADGWHFVSLNSNSSKIQVGANSAQYKWLQQDLAAVPADECTIVYYHHPLFNIGPEGPTTAMADIWSLLAQYGVDIVLNGHDHDYQRWVPLDGNGQPSVNGITEFVAGVTGHGIAAIGGSDPRVAYSNSMNPSAFGVLLLQLNQAGANFSYLNTTGSVLDSGVIPCVPARPDSQAPTTPGGLSADVPALSRVDLSWTASSDDVGVAGYTIYRNGAPIQTVPAVQLKYSDTTVAASTTYSYSVDAFDLAGNHSPVTAPVSVRTDYILAITSAHGTVTRDNPGPYQYGDVVQLTAVPDAGWTFANWSGDLTGTSNPDSITINGGKTVTAHYTQNVYTLTVNSAHGTVNIDNPGPYHYGDVVQLTAVPDTGWRLANWSGGVTGTSNPVSLTIHGNTTVTANYSLISYTLTIGSAHGTVDRDNPGPYHYGDIVQLTALPDAGWSFANWTGDLTGTNNPVSITINGNTALDANYTQNVYTLTVSSAHGTVNRDNPGPYHYGDVVQLTAVPDAGWSLASWSGDASGTTNPLSITINADTAVTANYSQYIYTLTVTSLHGTVNADTPGPYHYGDVVQLTDTPDPGWTFSNWSGDLSGVSNPVSITINANKAVTANYAAIVYVISGSAGVSGATITYDGGSTVSDGSGNYSFTVPWSWSGTVIPSKFGYVFSPPSRTYPALTADQVGQNYTAAAPAFTASPASWNYGLIKVGTASAARTFTVKNTGAINLTIGAVTLSGVAAGQFHITADGCSALTLAPNGTCTITTTFMPTGAGAKAAYINFPDNAPGQPHKILLAGKGAFELVLNGGFNAYPSGTATIPTNWSAVRFAASDGKDPLTKQEGTASVRIANTSAQAKVLTQTRSLSGLAGNTFLLSVWGKGQDIPATAGLVRVQIQLYNGTSLVQTQVLTFPNGTYGFTHKKLAFTASGAYTSLVARLIYSKATGTIWFDGMSLLRSP